MIEIITLGCDYTKNGVDEIRIHKDFDNEIGVAITEDNELARVCLTQENARRLAIAILENLDLEEEA